MTGSFDKTSAAGWTEGVAFAMEAGMVQIPYALLKHYRTLRLTDGEMLLLMQLLAFKQAERNEFPTWEQLQTRLGCTANEIALYFSKLTKEGFLRIDSVEDRSSSVQFERYNLTGLYRKLAECMIAERTEANDEDDFLFAGQPEIQNGTTQSSPTEERNLFTIFEKEFGRPLSPMEYETINSWMDQDRYPEELILLALKEAVFAGKVHFRYIDRILLEWSRNRVRNAQDAKEYAQRFRGGGRS
ncbi:DnaD domain-containing protein [Paenibacillus kribbensis]|uniref:DnaD domain-containing protein n=1 Tax=Paenibacillus kribbensis TaxID=172713 RepID=UPI002DBB6E33|nr:DnaD domain-containing protein [Paenibacillus kribbensis]MEC0237479.1 DnaD domain-containing protein [Paenibacillus kribbensis]